MRKVLLLIGTHAEAIRMASVVCSLRAEPAVQTIVCLTAQHSRTVEVLDGFGIRADEDLHLTKLGQPLGELHASVMSGIEHVIEGHRPDCMLVQGDTTTAMAAGMAAFYRHVPVGHVDAGVRTHDLHHPWPEEVNRRVLDLVATHHFAPTDGCRINLLKEGIAAEKIKVTGNTVIDALLMVDERIRSDDALRAGLAAAFPFLEPSRRLILVSGRRYENHGGRLESVCRALRRLAMRPDVQVVYLLPHDLKARCVVCEVLGGHPNIHLVEPQGYFPLIYLMRVAYLILTDSRDIQGEAPSLGKPVLVMRDVTEHLEGVDAGTIRLVGTDTDRILMECTMFLDDVAYYRAFSGHPNPYGDGQAGQRIVAALLR